MEYVERYLQTASRIIDKVDRSQVCRMIDVLKEIKKDHGRIFFLGVGGSAANASHAVNDFRKICGFEAYTPVDNVSELSARTNDDGWETVFVNWLRQSRLSAGDAIFVFSVGGGDVAKNVSPNIVRAVQYAKERKAKVLGIVGRNGGHTALHADACVVIPPVDTETITPHTEAFQAVIWHLLVSHPELKQNEMKWESVAKGEKNGDIS
ncbi:MAG: SIS domain-containing protein [Candidatus Aminicenantales bacterium]|jgi:D-sedoheptulose 7-phosphate isomerase